MSIAVLNPNYAENSTDIRFRSVSGESQRYRGYNGHKLLHPHMTQTWEPCFGDFGGPIHEAFNAGDLVTGITVVGMFLQQFDQDDGAGRFFGEWPDASIKEEPSETDREIDQLLADLEALEVAA